MRDIKFRAWDAKIKKMIYSDDFDYLSFFWIETELNNLRENLMQYTGLKDKNGKEVYEGDIIEFDKYEWYRSPVRSIEDIDKLPEHREKITFDHEGVSRSKNDLGKYCEVIGNIYEDGEKYGIQQKP